MGGNPLVLVGFDMQGDASFYKRYKRPASLQRMRDYSRFAPLFDDAAKHLPPGIQILNATPGSAIRVSASDARGCPDEASRMSVEYDGGSFVLGGLVVAALLNAISPWWLLLAPLCLLSFEALTWRLR